MSGGYSADLLLATVNLTWLCFSRKGRGGPRIVYMNGLNWGAGDFEAVCIEKALIVKDQLVYSE